MPRGRHRDDEDEGDPAGPGPAAPFGASTKVTPAGPVDGNDVFSPEAAAILQRRWRDSAAALRETASTLKGLGSSNLRWGVQPTEYLQMLSLPSVSAVSSSPRPIRVGRACVDASLNHPNRGGSSSACSKQQRD